MRTFSQGDWRLALEAWDEGEFSPEWKELRHTMAMQGVIFPPSGSSTDSWEDDQPSQRAVLIRAIRETPALLARCSRGASSWSQVIERLFAARDRHREERLEAEDEERERARELQPGHREAASSLADVLERVAASRGVL